ncbi:MAG TPA: hypothetical protein VLA12_10795, partial [Planctomycetaceae bacterium]|nr:hypothetical protein [Planctomycetaceae bacterium]
MKHFDSSPLTGRHLLDRRGFLGHASTGLSSLALSILLAEQGLLAQDDSPTRSISGKQPIRPVIDPASPFAPRDPHFLAAAKNVLVIFCSGACSHI